MNSLAVAAIVFGCVFGGAVIGMILRRIVPERQLNDDSRDLMKLGMGLIGTITALVLGLLIASTKSSFDTQRNEVEQLSATAIFLDRTLAHYGPETKKTRDVLRAAVADILQRSWPETHTELGRLEAKSGTEGRYEQIIECIHDLEPKTEAQRAWKKSALKTAERFGRMRWLLFAQKGSSIPTPFLVVMVAWLAFILASFSLFAWPNATATITLLLCAVAVSSAVFLILELDQPFDGIIQVPSSPLRGALEQLGK